MVISGGIMSLLVVGSVAFDSVKTPFGRADKVLGGSATYFSVSASYFTDIRLVAVVGNDFSDDHFSIFQERSIDIEGLEKREGETFQWEGEYSNNLNEAQTLDTKLNVLADFKPKIPETYLDSEYVFLANIDPDLQRDVLSQVKKPKLVACDTMNYWIEGKLDSLKKTLKLVDLLVINEGEARSLAEEPNLVKASRKILSMGPDRLIVKRGEYGAFMFSNDQSFAIPAFPMENVYDPTGAGDTFGGGLMGYLASVDNITDETLRQGIILGSAMASFNVEDFSLNKLKDLTYTEIEERFRAFKKLTYFEDIDNHGWRKDIN